jgi:hypothetical protein
MTALTFSRLDTITEIFFSSPLPTGWQNSGGFWPLLLSG